MRARFKDYELEFAKTKNLDKAYDDSYLQWREQFAKSLDRVKSDSEPPKVRWRIIQNKDGETLMWQIVDHVVIPCKPTKEDEKRAATKPGIYDENFKLIEHQPPPWKKKNARTR